MNEGLQAGFGRRDITPRKPCFLVGYPHVGRTSTGVHDPLFASALFVGNGENGVLCISVDWLFVSADWTWECRRRIAAETGLAPEAILISATHTHSGPHTVDILAWKEDPVVPPADDAYLEYACGETAAAAIDAWRGRVAAEAAWTTADVSGLAGGNRIDPHGAEDPEAGLLVVRRAADQAALAVLTVYGMHPTVLHEDSTLFSGDFIAFARARVEESFAGAGVVYLNGVCGNQSPRRAVRAQTFAEAGRIGTALGERLAQAVSAVTGFSTDPPLAALTVRLDLEGKIFPSVSEAELNLTIVRKRYSDLQAAGAERAVIRTAECTVFGAEEVLTLAKAEVSGEAADVRERYRTAEIQVLRVGGTFLAGWPGEFFVEYGLEVKRRSASPVFVATMANGELHGYVVTPDAEATGGYEAQMSLFPASTGARFVETTLELINKLS